MRRAQLIGLAVIVVASGLWATPAVGQQGTGNQLLSDCAETLKTRGDRTKDFQASAICMAFIKGIADVSNFPDTPLYRRICIPSGAVGGQGVRIVFNWLEDHPERLHEPDGHLIIEALREGWPCSP